MEGEGEAINAVEDFLPSDLAVDDEPMDDNETLEDVEQDIERVRNRAPARTLFRQPRSDNDTVWVFMVGFV
jgi:hypothetical protein